MPIKIRRRSYYEAARAKPINTGKGRGSAGKGKGVGGGGGSSNAAPPLDGTSPTGAWSVSRQLLSTYSGSFYSLTSGNIDTIYNQEGTAGRNFIDQGVATNRPALANAGPQSRECAYFDGVNNFLQTGASTLDTFIDNNAGYIIASVMIDAITTNGVNIEDNDTLWRDSGGFTGVHFKNGGGSTYTASGYNWDGTRDVAPAGGATIALNTAYVIEWLHSGGNVQLRINRGTWDSVASGNTTTMTNLFQLARGTLSIRTEKKLFEMATYATPPSSAVQDSIAGAFMSWIGAV